jgi:hypothetical protein
MFLNNVWSFGLKYKAISLLLHNAEKKTEKINNSLCYCDVSFIPWRSTYRCRKFASVGLQACQSVCTHPQGLRCLVRCLLKPMCGTERRRKQVNSSCAECGYWSMIRRAKKAVGISGAFCIKTFNIQHAVAKLVEALCYKPESRGFESRWSHWLFQLT